MGMTIIQKSDLSVKKDNPKVALVLSGGSISGGAYKLGGLKALNDYLINKKLTDFDIYVGLSAGGILAVPLAGGIDPEEMLASLDGKSKKFSQLSPFHLYRPNYLEFITRPLNYFYGHVSYLPSVLLDIIKATPKIKDELCENAIHFLKRPNYSNYELLTKPLLKIAYANRKIPGLGEILPSGIFDNRNLEKYVRQNMKDNKIPNNFRVLKKSTGKSLYLVAMDLDLGQRVIFGPDEKNDVNISEAVQASTAAPGIYKPARIKGVDYVDGAVRRTANIDLALEKGADLVICYNPFRPYSNKLFLEYIREENKYITKNKRLTDWGLGLILNQVFRTLFHSRLQAGLKILKNDPNFKKDIIVIEPSEDDTDFFTLNPFFFWNRAKAAKMGFESVTRSVEKRYKDISKILDAYGIKISKDMIDSDMNRMNQAHFDDKTIMQVLEHKVGKNPKDGLKILKGGKTG